MSPTRRVSEWRPRTPVSDANTSRRARAARSAACFCLLSGFWRPCSPAPKHPVSGEICPSTEQDQGLLSCLGHDARHRQTQNTGLGARRSRL